MAYTGWGVGFHGMVPANLFTCRLIVDVRQSRAISRIRRPVHRKPAGCVVTADR